MSGAADGQTTETLYLVTENEVQIVTVEEPVDVLCNPFLGAESDQRSGADEPRS